MGSVSGSSKVGDVGSEEFTGRQKDEKAFLRVSDSSGSPPSYLFSPPPPALVILSGIWYIYQPRQTLKNAPQFDLRLEIEEINNSKMMLITYE